MIIVCSTICLLLGFLFGWLSSEKYTAFLLKESHEFDELFEENPHPEIFKSNGEIYKGEYMNVRFDLGYDPDEFEPDDIVEGP